MLIDIDDFKIVSTVQSVFADRTDILNCAGGPRRRSADEEPQAVICPRLLCEESLLERRNAVSRFRPLHTPACGVRGRRSSPTSTRSAFERSPMIFLTGSGSLR